MIVNVTLNIYDAVRLIKEGLERENPSLEVSGITVMSWYTTLLKTENDMLVEPVRHRLDKDHSTL